MVLLITGTYLTFFFEGSQQKLVYNGSYRPLRGAEVSAAYDSAMRISFDVKGGLLIRQMHHWAALVFIGAIALHMARVFFTGAFRKPRDINWVVGVLLLILGLAAGFTGYSLPDDLLSGSGLRITEAIILAIPFVGERVDVPDLRRRVARHRHHRPAVPGAHPADPGGHRRPARGAPGAGVAPEAHPVPRAGTHRGQRHRAARVAGLRDQVDRPAVPGRRDHHGNGRAVPRQRDLALRPVRRGVGDLVLAARLVHRLPRGVGPPVPAVGAARRRVHDQHPHLLGGARSPA